MSVPEIATTATAGAAALAAFASWASVIQTRRWQKEQRAPELTISLGNVLDAGYVRIHVENVGGGSAQGIQFWALHRDNVCAGALPPNGSLRPGARITLRTELPSSTQQTKVCAVVIAFGDGYLHAWNAGGIHRRWRTRTRRVEKEGPSLSEIIRTFYPTVEDPSAYDRALYAVEVAE
jgi:hypothetical protein